MATWHSGLWSPGRGGALFAVLGLYLSQRWGGPLSFFPLFSRPPPLLALLHPSVGWSVSSAD